MSGKRKNGEGTWGKKTIKGFVYAFYRDSDGRYYYGKTEKEVREKIKKGSVNKTLKKETAVQTFGEYMLEWLESQRNSVEATTYISYCDALEKRFLKFTDYDLANVLLPSLNSEMFQNYLDALSKLYSLNSIKKTWSLIKRGIRYAEVKETIKPLHLDTLVKMPSEANVAVQRKKIAVPNVDDVNKIYHEAFALCKNGARKYGNGAYVAILILYTGVRVSEIIGLKWSNVDLVNNEIHINSTLAMIRTQDNDGKKHYSHKDKGVKTEDSERTIPLPDNAIMALHYFEKYKKCDNDYVCVNDVNGNHYTRRQIERTLERIVKNSGCQANYTPHGLRHGYGSILISKGVDIKVVSELLGHSDVAFTYNVYIDIFKNDKIEAVKQLNAI